MTTPYWQTIPFSPAPCLPCCSAPTGCACGLLIPPLDSPYGSYADAQTAITDQTNGCIAYADYGGGDTGTSISASFDGTTITAAATSGLSSPSLGLRVSVFVSVTLKSGATLTIPWTIATDAPATFANASLFYCADGTLADSDVIPPDAGPSGTLTLIAPADGEYVFKIEGGGTLGFTTFSNLSFTATCDMVYWVNPVIAQWDDSGTTRNLWACPKLLLPPLTESTGDWYASCADANTVLTDPLQVSNCVGFFQPAGFGLTSFTAIDGGTSLTFSTVWFLNVGVTGPMWGGVNAEAGKTITVTSTSGAGTPGVNVNIYDDAGALVTASGSVASPWTSPALPYTGRYTVSVDATSTIISGTHGVVITSSGTLSVNPIQSLYDLGLTCAARLNCGDACP